jgi:hypothetical protein
MSQLDVLPDESLPALDVPPPFHPPRGVEDSDDPESAGRRWTRCRSFARSIIGAKKRWTVLPCLLVAWSAAIWFTTPDRTDPWMLVQSTDQTGTQFHVIEPGQQPSPDNRLMIDAGRLQVLTTPETPEIKGDTVFAIATSVTGESLAVIDVVTHDAALVAEDQLEQAWVFPERAIVSEQRDDALRCASVNLTGGRRELGSGSTCLPSPDGRYVAITEPDRGEGDGAVKVVRSATGEVPITIDAVEAAQSAGWVQFSPDGEFVAARGRGGAVSIFELATGTEVDRLSIRPADAECATCLQWNRLGSLVGVAPQTGEVELWHLGREPTTVQGFGEATFRAADSDDLLVRSPDSGVKMLRSDVEDPAAALVDVHDEALWFTLNTPAAPLRESAETLLVNDTEILRVNADGQANVLAKLSGPPVPGSPMEALTANGHTYLSFDVGGTREVVVVDDTSMASATWSGPLEPFEFVHLGDRIVARTALDGREQVLLLDADSITDVEVGGDAGEFARFGSDLYATRTADDGASTWIDRIGLDDLETTTAIRDHRVLAQGSGRSSD